MKKCQCCEKEVETVTVCSSAFAPISSAYCEECLNNHAECKFVCIAASKVYKHKYARRTEEWLNFCKVYVNGQYITLKEFYDQL